MQVAVNRVPKNYPRCIIEVGLANHFRNNGGISIWIIIVSYFAY